MTRALVIATLALLACGAARGANETNSTADSSTMATSTEASSTMATSTEAMTTEAPVPRPALFTAEGQLKIQATDIAFIDLSEEPTYEDGECTAFGLCTGLNDTKQLVEQRHDAINAKVNEEVAKITAAAAAQKAATDAAMAADRKAASQARTDLEGRLNTAINAAKAKLETADQQAADATDAKLTQLRTQLEGKISQASASLTTLANANAAQAAKSQQTADAAVAKADRSQQSANAAMTAIAEVCNAIPGRKWQNNKCTIIPGVASAHPASSCKQMKDLGYPSGGYYLKHPGSSRVSRAYCDNSYSGGGWELLHKIDGSSQTFRYDSGYWSSGSNVYRETVMNGNWGENVKAWGYNYGRYSTINLRWRDPHDGAKWTWTNPSGWSKNRSPQNYFNSGRHICCSRRSQVQNRMEWRNSGGRFSNQNCAGRLAVAQCTSGRSCARWGFHWNNECHFGSNDAGGGWGIRPVHRAGSAGDWITCCQHHHGRRRDFDANLWGRV